MSITKLSRRFFADESGAALLEYTVLVGIIVVAVVTAILSIGNWVATNWSTLNTTLTG